MGILIQYNYICMQKKKKKTHIGTLQILPLFDGLWKHQNNRACTESVSLQNTKKEEIIYI